MEKQRAFPGYKFKPYKPVDLIIRTEPTGAVPPSTNTPIEHKLIWDSVSQKPPKFGDRNEFGEINTVDTEPMTSRRLLQIFNTQIGKISESVEQPLPLDKIEIQFVSRTELHTRTAEEIAYLRERYGDYIIDGAAGECQTNDDGTYILRISESLLENDPSGDTTLEVMAHEYGHTLGEQLEDAVDEELKANAFANLFMMHYLEVDYYSNFAFTTDTVHAESKYRLDVLTSHVGPPDMLLAHLTGSTFGRYEPDDYLDHLSLKSRIASASTEPEVEYHSLIYFKNDSPTSWQKET